MGWRSSACRCSRASVRHLRRHARWARQPWCPWRYAGLVPASVSGHGRSQAVSTREQQVWLRMQSYLKLNSAEGRVCWRGRGYGAWTRDSWTGGSQSRAVMAGTCARAETLPKTQTESSHRTRATESGVVDIELSGSLKLRAESTLHRATYTLATVTALGGVLYLRTSTYIYVH